MNTTEATFYIEPVHLHGHTYKRCAIREVPWTASGPLKNLRRQVFIEEQKVSTKEEWDAFDHNEGTRHFLVVALADTEHNHTIATPLQPLTLEDDPLELFNAADTEEQPETHIDMQTAPEIAVATARLQEDGKLGRLAVIPECRRRGIATALAQHIGQQALVAQYHVFQDTQMNTTTTFSPTLYLHAQTDAQRLYEKLGFHTQGETFTEAGIKHIAMRFSPNKQSLQQLFGNHVYRFDTTAMANFHLYLQWVNGRKTLDLCCKNLTPLLYATKPHVAAISQLARLSRYSEIRILLQESKTLHGQNHPLVHLAQRLSSRIKLRVLNEPCKNPHQAYAITDGQLLTFFNDEEMLLGFANYFAPAESNNKLEAFNQLWDNGSHTDVNLESVFI